MTGIAALGMIAPVALAQTVSVNANANVNAGVNVGTSGSRASATGTANMNANATSSTRGSTGGSSATGTAMRLENRSGVAAQVQALLSLADRAGGIGPEVRVIAREYASTSARIGEAKDKVESRPGWMTVLIGADYRNLGALRSELSTTESQIKRLETAMDRSTDVTVKADLQVQINVLKAQASTTAEFVEENESSFSVFGWFVKIFS